VTYYSSLATFFKTLNTKTSRCYYMRTGQEHEPLLQ